MGIPTVSVVIPLYNSEKYIKGTIESILAQKFEDYELIIVDDCSMDNSVGEACLIQDKRVKVYRNQVNLGPEGNWNKCLEKARGKYIKLVCGDDLIYEGCLQRQVDILENSENRGVVMVSCGREIINESRGLMVRGLGKPEGLVAKEFIVKGLMRKGTNVIGEPAAVLFRRECLKEMKEWFRSPFYTVDVDFWCRLLKFGQLYYVDEPLCAFRISRLSGTSIIGLDQPRHYSIFMRRLYEDYPLLVGRGDILIGEFMSRLQCLARLVFIKIFV